MSKLREFIDRMRSKQVPPVEPYTPAKHQQWLAMQRQAQAMQGRLGNVHQVHTSDVEVPGVAGSAVVQTLDSMRSVLKVLWAREGMPPALLVGPPGCGKTSIVTQVAAECGMPCEVVIASLREPSDFAGLPVLVNGEVRLAPPAWAKRVAGTRAVVLLDEINTAPPATQAALLRVVLDRVVGDLDLGPGVRIVAAMNNAEDAANGWELAAPLANRFLHFSVGGPGLHNWASWLLGETITMGESAPVIDEERYQAEFGYLVRETRQMDEITLLGEPASSAYPTPRTWHMALKCAALSRAMGHAEIEPELVRAAVGVGPQIAWSTALEDSENVLEWSVKKKYSPDRVQRKIVRALDSWVAGKIAQNDVWKLANTALDHGHVATVYSTLGMKKDFLNKHAPQNGGLTELGQATMNRLKDMTMKEAAQAQQVGEAQAKTMSTVQRLRERQLAAKQDEDIPF